MRNFLKLAVMLLAMMFGSEVYAAPPSHGTVNGNTWTNAMPSPLDFSYSITPVPGTKMLDSGMLLTLALGSVLTVSTPGVDLEIWVITKFDDSDMGEHETEGPIFTGSAYTFNEPRQYTVWFKKGGDYSAAFVVEVN